VFEVIYMDIYVFTILKCRELKKNKKYRKYCGLFAVRMRTAKYARQRAHVALTCASWERARYPATAFAVRAIPGAHGKGYAPTHGNAQRTATI
jgi:hypothetical protein